MPVTETYAAAGSPRPGGARDRRLAGAIVLLGIAFVGVALAKPWGPSPGTGSAGTPSAGTESGGADPTDARPGAATATRRPAPAAFTTSVPPPASAPWLGLRWQRLAADDPRALVRSVERWSGGYVALGRSEGPAPTTPVWTSTDGARWEPVSFAAPGDSGRSLVIGIAAVETGLVALTEAAHDCGATTCSLTYEPPVVSWTSADGRTWIPHDIAPLPSPTGSVLLSTVGPAGVVVASSAPGEPVSVSADGIDWETLPADTLPTRVVLNDLHGLDSGYLAVGLQVTSDSRWDAATLWSEDGRRWSPVATLLPTSPEAGASLESVVRSVVAGRDGLIATGRELAWPGAALWWQSPDGQQWTALSDFAPLGPLRCTAERCVPEPNGRLVGDGERLVAFRGGADGAAWTSVDGRAWGRISMRGDIPGGQSTDAMLMPGGVLVTDGSTTWFGEPIIR
jgi:hypothetical protein